MSGADEQALVSSARSGDRDAFATLVRSYHPKVIGLCRSFLHDDALAEDAAADAFVKAYTSLSNYRGESAFGTWLYRIAANHCKDVLRQIRSRRADSLSALTDDKHQEIPDHSQSISSSLETKDLAERLMANLSEEHQTVLSLRELSGLSYDEIAATLNISLDAVKSRLKRARQQAIEIARHFLPSSSV